MPLSRNRSTSNGSIFLCVLLFAILLAVLFTPTATAAPFADDITPAAAKTVGIVYAEQPAANPSLLLPNLGK